MKSFSILFIFFILSFDVLNASDTKVLYVTAKSGLTLREKPGIKSKAITLIPAFSSVLKKKQTIELSNQERINNRTGNWVLISYKEFNGYAFDGYLSSIEPDPKNFFVGEYTSDLGLSKNFYPSYLYLNSNHQFEITVNLCHDFGTISGNWKSEVSKEETFVVLEPQKSDFGLKNLDKLKIIFLKSEEGLQFSTFISDKADPVHIGCDFGERLFFIKK
ncbi:SH3 domain-containing protein [Leptospira andrefontaineae]|uniref:SH3 domain-containing protein n=1 Tax=Leptospira andrefontaineae TaxID=2484976 RepID=A0A4V6QKY8_9LEPT|nr:SH3 domain-containing protein [Leptospira andrefontaineae]TGK37742.1 SH3 domain-containing protein [Leptospira andrefontaineae]